MITGTTAGAGYEATRVFLSKGARVVMLNRNPTKSAAATEALKAEFGADAEVSSIQMDLAMLDSVKKAAAEVLEEVPQTPPIGSTRNEVSSPVAQLQG